MNPVAEMLLNEPTPAAIWAALMLLCLPAVFLLASPRSLRHPRLALLDIVGAVRRRGEQRLRLQAEAVETIRYADEMRVAADQAISAAQRWEQRRDRAAVHSAAAWQAWPDAESKLTRLRAAPRLGEDLRLPGGVDGVSLGAAHAWAGVGRTLFQSQLPQVARPPNAPSCQVGL
jgi:hypothetical protein